MKACDNFYEFACGGWKRKFPRPFDAKQWSTWTMLKEKITEDMIEMMSTRNVEKTSLAVKKTKQYFESCMDSENQSNATISDLINLFDSIGGFPLLNKSWSEENFDWQKVQPPQLLSYEISFDNDFEIIAVRDKTSEFREEIKKKLAILKIDLSDKELEEYIDELIDFDRQLFQDSKSYINTENMSLLQMEYAFKGIDWFQIFSQIFNSVGFKITTVEQILIKNYQYFRNLGDRLKSQNSRTLANYIGAKLLLEIDKYRILDSISNTKEIDERALRVACYHLTENSFHNVINYKYLQHNDVSKTLEEFNKFRMQMKEAFILAIKQSKWMSDNGKEWANSKEKNSYYFPIICHLLEPTLAAIQPPFFYSFAPIALNFGAIGTIIGHEIVHKYFESKFNEFKNIKNQSVALKMMENFDCLKNQYSKIVEHSVNKVYKINGSRTLGGNIADNLGVQLAFSAYKIFMTANDIGIKLPAAMSRFTRKQLFFIGYANVWCNNHDESFIHQQFEFDVHSPSRYRVIVPLQNSETFLRTFDCKKGSYMNP
ncbi:hypothetical protein B4U79_01126, partial [Dinothrombium tinctorium]